MTIKPIFKAIDDSEHTTAAAAKLHNGVVEAIRSFKKAAELVQRRIKERAMTADGVPFTEAGTEFWWLCGWGGGLPRLILLYIWPYHSEIEERENGDLMVSYWDGERKDHQRHRIRDLYSDRKKAREAHVDACEKRLAELAGEFNELKTDYAKG